MTLKGEKNIPEEVCSPLSSVLPSPVSSSHHLTLSSPFSPDDLLPTGPICLLALTCPCFPSHVPHKSPHTNSGSHPRADQTRCCEILNRPGPTRCLLGQKTSKEQSEGWKHSVARDVRRELGTKRHDALGKFFASCLLQLMTCCLAEEPPALCAEDRISVRPIAPVACLKSSLADLQSVLWSVSFPTVEPLSSSYRGRLCCCINQRRSSSVL